MFILNKYKKKKDIVKVIESTLKAWTESVSFISYLFFLIYFYSPTVKLYYI